MSSTHIPLLSRRHCKLSSHCYFFFQAEDGIRDADVTGVQTCALPISVGTAAGGAATGARGTSGGFGRGSSSGFGRTGTGSSYPGSTGMGTSPFGSGVNPQATAQPGAGSSFSDRLRNIINKAAVSGEIQVLGQTK